MWLDMQTYVPVFKYLQLEGLFVSDLLYSKELWTIAEVLYLEESH